MSSGVDLLSRIRGSAAFLHKGQILWAKDVGKLNFDQQPFSVDSDSFGSLAKRRGARNMDLTFTPVGVATAAQFAVTHPYAQYLRGDLNTPVRKITAVTHAAGTLTVPNHRLITGTGIRIGFGGRSAATLPTGLALNTTYFVVVVDANTIKLSDKEQHAVAGTNLIAMTGDGTGKLRLVVNAPLIIWTVDGVKLTIWNAAVAEMASLTLSAVSTIFGSMKVEGYTRHGMNWSDANSLYEIDEIPFPSWIVPPNPNLIPTVPYTIDWATALPVTALSTDTHVLTVTQHGLLTGQAVTLEADSEDGVLPAGFAAGTAYYVIVVDGDNISLADTQMHALAGTNAIAFTDEGTGPIEVLSLTQVLGLEPREAIQLTFPVKWKDVVSDRNGLNCRSIDSVDATAKFLPTNLEIDDELTEMILQDEGADRGADLTSANLDIYGPGESPFIRIYGASLANGSAMFGSQEDRTGEMNFQTKRTFRGATANPVFFLGLAAPTV